MPNTEPNSLPLLYVDWSEWREAYKQIADNFNKSPKTYSDEVLLRIRLKRLGFVSVHLDREIKFIKEGCK